MISALPFLAAATLSCADANWILQGAMEAPVSEIERSEIILTIMEDTEQPCEFIDLERKPRR